MAEFYIRTGEGISFYYGSPPAEPTTFAPLTPPFASSLPSGEAKATASAYSEDGSLFSWCASGRLRVTEVKTGKVLLDTAQVAEEIIFSPSNSFVAVWHKGHFARERPKDEITTKDIRLQDGGKLEVHRVTFTSSEVQKEQMATQQMIESNEPRENLVIFDLASGQQAARFFQRERESWKPQWTEDDQFCVRMVTNNLHIYGGRSLNSENMTVHPVEKIAAFSLYSKSPHRVAVFTIETASQPATLSFFDLASPTKTIATKSFYKAKEAALFWSFDGAAVLASTWAHNTDFALYCLTRSLSAKIILDPGPINLILWSPATKNFAVLHSNSRKLAVYNPNGELTSTFPEGQYRKELIRFSPNGKYLTSCRIVDSKLHVQIRDLKGNKDLSKIETAKQLSFLAWHPSSTLLILASHRPFVTNDNGLSVFSLAMKSIFAVRSPELLQIQWRPLASKKTPAAAAAPEAGSEAAAVKAEAEAEDAGLTPEAEKRIRNLRKKLTQIEELKDKLDIGLILDEDQMKKLRSEGEVQKEIDLLLSKGKQKAGPEN